MDRLYLWFRYPVSYHAWTPLQPRASYGALEGDPIGIIGRLKAIAIPGGIEVLGASPAYRSAYPHLE